MFQLFKILGSALAGVITDRVIQKVNQILDGASSLSMDDQKILDRAMSDQALAAVIYARFGIAGLASAYDEGVISPAIFAAYIVKGESFRVNGVSTGRILNLEENSREEGFIGSTFSDLSEVTTDPDAISRMYGYLLASNSLRD